MNNLGIAVVGHNDDLEPVYKIFRGKKQIHKEDLGKDELEYLTWIAHELEDEMQVPHGKCLNVA